MIKPDILVSFHGLAAVSNLIKVDEARNKKTIMVNSVQRMSTMDHVVRILLGILVRSPT